MYHAFGIRIAPTRNLSTSEERPGSLVVVRVPRDEQVHLVFEQDTLKRPTEEHRLQKKADSNRRRRTDIAQQKKKTISHPAFPRLAASSLLID